MLLGPFLHAGISFTYEGFRAWVLDAMVDRLHDLRLCAAYGADAMTDADGLEAQTTLIQHVIRDALRKDEVVQEPYASLALLGKRKGQPYSDGHEAAQVMAAIWEEQVFVMIGKLDPGKHAMLDVSIVGVMVYLPCPFLPRPGARSIWAFCYTLA